MNFDWQQVVMREYPSNAEGASESQRARHALYVDEIHPALVAWAHEHSFDTAWPGPPAMSFDRYVRGSAYAAVVRTPEVSQRAHALGQARFITWLSGVDVLVDDELLPRLLAMDLTYGERMAHLDTALTQLCAPFVRAGQLSAEQRSALLGTEKGAFRDDDSPDFVTDIPLLGRLDGALTDLLAEWSRAPSASAGDRQPALARLAREVAVFLGGIRKEAGHAIRFHEASTVPDLVSYLDDAFLYHHTILALSYVLIPGLSRYGSWEKWLPALRACAVSCRLFNDHGSLARELKEGKLSSVGIALAMLGHDLKTAYDLTDEVVQRALALQSEWMWASLEDFSRIIDELSTQEESVSPQVRILRVSGALYPAMYGRGQDFNGGSPHLDVQLRKGVDR